MRSLVAFASVAVTSCQIPWYSSAFDWACQPTAIGYLHFDPDAPDGTSFDLALRVRGYGERSSLLARWAGLNVKPGPVAAWNLRGRHVSLLADRKEVGLNSLYRHRSSAPGCIVDLKRLALYGADLRSACAEFGIACDDRDADEKFDDYYSSSADRAVTGILLDTVATFRLALADALLELRGGNALRLEIEGRLMENVAELTRLAVGEVPALSEHGSQRQIGHARLGPQRF